MPARDSSRLPGPSTACSSQYQTIGPDLSILEHLWKRLTITNHSFVPLRCMGISYNSEVSFSSTWKPLLWNAISRKKRKERKKKKRKRGLSVEALGTEHTLHFPSGKKAYTAGLTASILTISLYSLTAWSPSLCVLFLHFFFKYPNTSTHFRIELYWR